MGCWIDRGRGRTCSLLILNDKIVVRRDAISPLGQRFYADVISSKTVFTEDSPWAVSVGNHSFCEPPLIQCSWFPPFFDNLGTPDFQRQPTPQNPACNAHMIQTQPCVHPIGYVLPPHLCTIYFGLFTSSQSNRKIIIGKKGTMCSLRARGGDGM